MEQRRIKITVGDVAVTAVLNNSHTADMIWDVLPMGGEGFNEGNEAAFQCPVTTVDENPLELVDMGAVVLSPSEGWFCMFYGPTPSSRTPDEIKPQGTVNAIGSIEGDPTVIRGASNPAQIRVERA